eukprot:UC4_evm1s1068
MEGFWKMVWQEETSIIIMLTNEVENGKLKCHRYWPDVNTSGSEGKKIERISAADSESKPDEAAVNFESKPHESAEITAQLTDAALEVLEEKPFEMYGDIKVQLIKKETFQHYIVRTFTINFEGETRECKQYHYIVWPDHGVPLTTQEILGFRAAIRDYETQSKPWIVHCSAGVGRTGSFIAIDSMLNRAAARWEDMNIDDLLKAFRMARNYMIQTDLQFIFVHTAIFDALEGMLQSEREKSSEKAQLNDAALTKRKAEIELLKTEMAERQAAKQAEYNKLLQEIHHGASSVENANTVAKITGGVTTKIKSLQSTEGKWMENYKKYEAKRLEATKAWEAAEQDSYGVDEGMTETEAFAEGLRAQGIIPG